MKAKESSTKSLLNFMEEMKKHSKAILNDIHHIDRQVNLKIANYHHLTSIILQSASVNKNIDSTPDTIITCSNSSLMERQQSLSSEIKSQLKHKTRLCQQLFNYHTDVFDSFDDFLEDDLNCQSQNDASQFLNACLGSDEIANIIVEYQAKQMESLCICKGSVQDENMIKCDESTCSARWYHLKCAGLNNKHLPKGKWVCSYCKSK